MKNSSEILTELQTIAPFLANMEKVNVFDVPDGYFNQLPERISTVAFLSQDEKNSFQSVPDGYFDSLSSKILSRIKESTQTAEEEIKELSPALHYLKAENVFSVPENYFDDLSDRITEKIGPGAQAKVVSINTAKKWWKYAAAAVVAGIIAITSVTFYNNDGSGSNEPAYIKLSAQYKTPSDLQEGIASLSADDIAKYLEKNTTVFDYDSLINNTDTKELPAPDDYLIDENTLNDYLKTINAQELTNPQ